MGTRCLTVIRDRSEEIAVLYRQYDGYPEGHGAELKEFLDGFKIVNGIPMAYEGKIADGAQCLAAQIVAHFKTVVGNFYLYPAGMRGLGEEYIYTVFCEENKELIITTEG